MTTIDVAVVAFWTTLSVLIYYLIAYPILLSLLALVFGRGRSAEEPRAEPPGVTLIVPAYNEELVLEAKLENALTLDFPGEKLEIIVASDGSSDRTAEIARKFAGNGVRLLDYNERRGKASVLADAVAAARFDVLCLCDANVMFHAHALAKLVARLDDATVGAATGLVRLASHESNFEHGETSFYRIERSIQHGESALGSLVCVDGGMYVIRRELFPPLPPDTILDDFAVSIGVIRQNQRIIFEPLAVADENGTPTASQEYCRRVRVAAGTFQSLKRGQWPRWRQPLLVWQYLSHKLLRWLGPIWLIALLAATVALQTSGTVYNLALAVQVVFYLAAALGAISMSVRRTRIGGVVFYFALSHLAMLIGMFKGLFNWQQVTWVRTERQAMSKSAAAGPQ